MKALFLIPLRILAGIGYTLGILIGITVFVILWFAAAVLAGYKVGRQ